MNEDFLLERFLRKGIPDPIEEYQNNFSACIKDYRDKVQWYIDHIRKTIKETSLHKERTMDEKELETLKNFQEEKKEHLIALDVCELRIKEDTNSLLNLIACSVNHKWKEYNLIKVAGFQSKKTSGSDVLIPLPIQYFYYISSSDYTLLVNCAIHAIIFKYEVEKFYKRTNEEILETLKEFKELKYKKERTIHNKQKDLANYILIGYVNYCKNIFKGSASDIIRKPGIPTIIKMMNSWNNYIKTSEDDQKKGTKPYPHYEKIIWGSKDYVIDWGEKIFAPMYFSEKIERKKQKEENRRKLGKSTPDALDRMRVEMDDETFDDLCSIEDNGFYYDESKD